MVEGPDGRRIASEEIDAAGLSPGTRLGRYVVLEAIGSGAMGVVLAAFDPELNRKVALKIMRATERDRRRERKGKAGRLLQEAQALAKLAHPNVITVYDVGAWEDRVFVAMELVEGDTLEGWLSAQKRRSAEVLSVFIPAGRGLAAAHSAGLVHRDFKPDNVLIGDDGRVRVMDFGLAAPAPETDTTDVHSAELREQSLELSSHNIAAPLLSQTGSMMGTPAYMAPEQHDRQATDPRSDQYSFCVALYRALYGTLPFSGEDVDTLSQQKRDGQVTEPSGAGVPSWLRKAVLRGLAADRTARWPSMDELLSELDNDPRVARRKWLNIGGAAILVGGSLGGVVYYRNQRPAVCRGAEDELAQVWNEDSKTAVLQGLAASAPGEATEAWRDESATRVNALVDTYAEEWVAMSTDACEATHVRVEQSLRRLSQRQECLDQRRAEIGAVAEVLAEADNTVALHAFDVVGALGPLHNCADPNILAAAVDPPEAEDRRAAVTTLQRSLARAQILDAAGRTTDAQQLASRLFEEARALDYPPIEAEARYRLGLVEAHAAHAGAAQEHLSEAHWSASSVKHDTIAAAAASALVDVVGIDLSRRDEGLGWARHAEAAFRRIGLGPEDEADLRFRVGSVHAANRNLDKARDLLEQAQTLYGTVSEDDPRRSLDRVRAMVRLADVRARLGALSEAEALLDEAHQTMSALGGPQHPELARVLTGLGRLDDARARYDRARSHYASAIDLLEATVGPDSPRIAEVLGDQARSFATTGDHAHAIALQERAVAILDKNLGPHPSVAAAKFELGRLHLGGGRKQLARADWDAALTLWEETLGKDHPALAFALMPLASLDLEDGQPKVAVQRLERALKVRGRKGLAPTVLADTQFALAKALHQSGEDRARARELARKARDLYNSEGANSLHAASSVDRWLSRVARDDGGELLNP